MNARLKRRLAAGTGIIVIVLVVLLAVVGGNAAAKETTVADAAAQATQAAQAAQAGQGRTAKKIQVTGNVVENSYAIDGNTLTFAIYDPQADPGAVVQLRVRHDGGVSATFGNDVTAICTGKLNAQGELACTELVTKCPSKYENATDALTIDRLLDYGESVLDKPVKVTGVIQAGTLAGVDSPVRFVLEDAEMGAALPICYTGALSDETVEGATVVLTGSLSSDGAFAATNVALEA